MADLTTDERLFLLSRSAGGRDRSLTGGLDIPLAAATLAALDDLGAVDVAGDRVVAVAGPDLSRPHLQAARDVIADAAAPRTVTHWLHRLPRVLRLQENVGSTLADRGIVQDGGRRILTVRVKRFRPSDPDVACRVARETQEILTGRHADPDPAARLLSGLVGSAGLLASLVEPADRRRARRRARELLRASVIGTAVLGAVATEWNCPRARLAALAQAR